MSSIRYRYIEEPISKVPIQYQYRYRRYINNIFDISTHPTAVHCGMLPRFVTPVLHATAVPKHVQVPMQAAAASMLPRLPASNLLFHNGDRESVSTTGSRQKLTTSRDSPLTHAYHVWSTSVSAFASYPTHRMTDRTNDHVIQWQW